MGREQRRKAERRRARIQRMRDSARVEAGRLAGCLFCRRSDGGFTAQEHILPESMGNTTLVLANGIVCDRCNNGTLSDLDQTLCEFFPLKARRTILGIRSKAGKVPMTRFSRGRMSSPSAGNIVIDINGASDNTTFRKTGRAGGRVQVSMQMTGGRRITARYCSELSRALLKTALECAWLDHGEDMLGPEFDHVRDAVLGVPRVGFLALGREGDPDHSEGEVTYGFRGEPGERGIWVIAKYFGLYLATDSQLPIPVEAEAFDAHVIVHRFHP